MASKIAKELIDTLYDSDESTADVLSITRLKNNAGEDVFDVIISSDDISDDNVQYNFVKLLSTCKRFEVHKASNKNLKYTFVLKEW